MRKNALSLETEAKTARNYHLYGKQQQVDAHANLKQVTTYKYRRSFLLSLQILLLE